VESKLPKKMTESSKDTPESSKDTPESSKDTPESSKDTPESSKEITDYYKHLSLFWTDIIHLMSSKPQALTSIGPMRAFATNSKK
jgi:hypothetical protein